MGTGSKGLATSFKDFVGNVSAKFSAPAEVPLTPEQVSANARATSSQTSGSQASKDLAITETETGPIKPSAEKVARTEAQIAAKAETAARKASAAKLNITPSASETITVTDVADAASVDEGKSFIDSYKEFKENIGKKDIIGTNISVSEAVGVTKDATGVFTAYKYFNPDDVESGFLQP